MASKRALRLFAQLREVSFGPGKPDRHENLLDLLEIVAVCCGAKRAHLQGQGWRDAATSSDLRAVVRSHGLATRETDTLPSWHHRQVVGDLEFAAWVNASHGEPRGRVLWVYSDERVSREIEEVMRAKVGPGAVLGYPTCCEIHSSERSLQLHEAMEHGYRHEHGAQTTADLIRFYTEDRTFESPLLDEAHAQQTASTVKYPFIQFVACAACIENNDSPAATVNMTMRRLAMQLGAAFARDITDAAQTRSA